MSYLSTTSGGKGCSDSNESSFLSAKVLSARSLGEVGRWNRG
ncbi:MAG: hypothetical protein ABI162_08100 [Luteolibacter sp.]